MLESSLTAVPAERVVIPQPNPGSMSSLSHQGKQHPRPLGKVSGLVRSVEPLDNYFMRHGPTRISCRLVVVGWEVTNQHPPFCRFVVVGWGLTAASCRALLRNETSVARLFQSPSHIIGFN